MELGNWKTKTTVIWHLFADTAMEEAFMTEFANCSSLEDQVSSSNLQDVLFHQNLCRSPSFIKIQRYLECSRSGCFWQKVGKMRQLRKRWRPNVGKTCKQFNYLFLREKSKATCSSRRERIMMLWNSTTGKHYNREWFQGLIHWNQGPFVSSRGQSSPPDPLCQPLCSSFQDEQVHRLCRRHWRGPEVGLPGKTPIQGAKVVRLVERWREKNKSRFGNVIFSSRFWSVRQRP